MRKLFLLVPALLLAGCRGEQVAFQFQPAAATSVPMATIPAVAGSQANATPAALATENQAAGQPTTPTKPAKKLHPRRLATALKALPQSTLATLAAPTRASQQLAQHIGRRHATEGAAESGLGRVALFFIGVTLAVLAGLAALVNLIFSVGFFTALGYTAAGLVVLFILYSLLSGGKKKKA
jgi:uncharacterized membrane protein